MASAEDWREVGYVASSEYRTAVLASLSEGPAMPTTLVEKTGFEIAHISRTLGGLRDKGLVKLLVPEEMKKGRIYGITDRGEEVLEQVERV